MIIISILYILLVGVLVVSLLLPLKFNLLYLFFTKKTDKIKITREVDIACIITAYKNADLAVLAIESLQNQQYNNYHIYLVADACELSQVTLEPHERLTVLVPISTLGSKVKSMKYAIENFIREHEAVAILDSDNLADRNFLLECNYFLAQGYKVVQGRRTAKNLDSKIACLDAMGEIYYNYTTRKVPFALGSSATIAGSGMIIEKQLFCDFFKFPYIKENIDSVIPGEDKILYYYVVSKGFQAAYNENAIVFDEKINSAGKVKNQRARWINAYRLSLKDSAKLFYQGIKYLNLNKFIAGILTLYPPLFLLILCTLFLLIVSYFFSIAIFLTIIGCAFLFILNFIWILKINKPNPKIWSAIWSIPYFMVNQILALTHIKKSNRDFLTTQNTTRISIKEVVENDKL